MCNPHEKGAILFSFLDYNYLRRAGREFEEQVILVTKLEYLRIRENNRKHFPLSIVPTTSACNSRIWKTASRYKGEREVRISEILDAFFLLLRPNNLAKKNGFEVAVSSSRGVRASRGWKWRQAPLATVNHVTLQSPRCWWPLNELLMRSDDWGTIYVFQMYSPKYSKAQSCAYFCSKNVLVALNTLYIVSTWRWL